MNCPHCHHPISDEELRSAWASRSAGMRTTPGRKRSTQKRCPCGAMTLKRAEARGRSTEHEPACAYYKDPPVPVAP